MIRRTCTPPRIRAILWWIVLPLVLGLYTTAWLLPATWWYEPKSVIIRSDAQGTDLAVSIDRQIKSTFDGRYMVSVWGVPPDGHVACAGSDYLRYKGGLYQPHTMPLSHWADDPWCAKLPPGDYYAEACWTVLRPFLGIVPAKTVCINSNVFRIIAREGA